MSTIAAHLRRPGANALLGETLDTTFEVLASGDSILRAELGHDGPGVPELDVVDLDATAASEARLAGLARRLDALAGLDRVETYCADVVRAEIWQRSEGRPQSETLRRVPYWYLEHLGDAYRQALRPAAHRDPTLLVRRVRATPRLLETARRNLDWGLVPTSFLRPTARAGDGVRALIASLHQSAQLQHGGGTVDQVAPIVQPSERELGDAGDAVSRFVEDCQRSVEETGAAVVWRFGPERFDEMLVRYYRLDTTAGQLFEQGQALVATHQNALRDLAAADPKRRAWTEILDDARRDSPSAERLVETYRDEVGLAREHVVATGLVSLPAGERCSVGSVPEYLRHGLPMGVMDVVSPFGADLESSLLITPVDLTSADGGSGHLAESNRSFLRTIVGHETYPGHHVQGVHHKLALSGLPACAVHRNPSFVEGWGFYAEDVLQATGLFDTLELQVTKERNALWRAARLVVDSGMHSHKLSPEAAVALLERECVMSAHMASGEVQRYLRHDNATYPSSYVLGADRFRALRSWWDSRRAPSVPVGRFHDLVLSAGSPPVGLVTEELLEALELLGATGTTA